MIASKSLKCLDVSAIFLALPNEPEVIDSLQPPVPIRIVMDVAMEDVVVAFEFLVILGIGYGHFVFLPDRALYIILFREWEDMTILYFDMVMSYVYDFFSLQNRI